MLRCAFAATAEEEWWLRDEEEAEQREQATAELAPGQLLAECDPAESARAEQVDPLFTSRPAPTHTRARTMQAMTCTNGQMVALLSKGERTAEFVS